MEDVSYASGDDRVEGYLVSPSSTSGKVPAVVFLHGAGDDREEQLDTAVKLAKRGAIALTITAPSGAKTPPAGATGEALVRWQGGTIADDVIAARRAFDLLADDDRVDADRLGLFGWSMGGRLAALVAGVDDRVRATVLMSAGAAPVDAYVEGAPAELQDVVREVLEPIDPLTRIDDAKGKVLVQAGRQDSIVPRAALEAVIEAAPKGTKVEWYETDHALNDQAADRPARLALRPARDRVALPRQESSRARASSARSAAASTLALRRRSSSRGPSGSRESRRASPPWRAPTTTQPAGGRRRTPRDRAPPRSTASSISTGLPIVASAAAARPAGVSSVGGSPASTSSRIARPTIVWALR